VKFLSEKFLHGRLILLAADHFANSASVLCRLHRVLLFLRATCYSAAFYLW